MNLPSKNNPPLLTEQNPWNDNSNAIWLGSHVTLIRNLDKFNFPGKLSTDKRKQIISLVNRELTSSQHLKNPKLIQAEEMPPIEKEFLMEHFLSLLSLHQAHAGEAFILDETAEFLAVLNLKDHLHLSCIDSKEELENTWDRLVKIESDLAKSINFAFSPKFGFLTSDPKQCGTGLIVTIFLHLPSLRHANLIEEILKKNKEESAEQAGLQGDPRDIIGNIVAFHNSFTLGLTEENILYAMRSLATKLVVEEKSLRQQFRQRSEPEQAELKDKVSRAYAILLHSYQIEAVEALDALSLLKLGLDFSWLQGTTHRELNRLFFAVRRAHLLCRHGKTTTPELLPHKRAEFIHQTLSGLELLI